MMSPRSRREAIEQGKAELNRLYELLPESSYDLSLRDLVESSQSTRLSFSGGLPVEQRQQLPEGSVSSPPDLLPFGHSSNRSNGFVSPPRSPARFRGSSPTPLLVKPAQISPRKVSPRPSPRSSPLWGNEQVKPIFPVVSFDAVNNRCSSCSAHVIFFKTRCPVCNRVYCNRCVKSSSSGCGSKCAAFSHHPPTKRKFAISCWPFPLSNSKHSAEESSHAF